MNHPTLRLGLVLLALALAAGGCGRRGAPRPPEDALPETLTKVEARNEAKGIVVSWERPETYVDGARMTDLAEFEIWRAVGAGEDDEAFTRLARMEVTDRDRFRQLERFRYVDVAVEAGRRYRYRVVSSTLDGYVSAPSNVADIERRAPE